MNKKVNTILFILGATLFNVLLTLGMAVLFLFLYQRFIARLFADQATVVGYAVIVCFVSALVASFFIYRGTMRVFTRKVDVDKYFDPIFGPRRPGWMR
jgi:hypothetical protein